MPQPTPGPQLQPALKLAQPSNQQKSPDQQPASPPAAAAEPATLPALPPPPPPPRPPPSPQYAEHLAAWQGFARGAGASTREEDYTPIFADLASWDAAGGVNGSTVRRAAAASPRVQLFTLNSSGAYYVSNTTSPFTQSRVKFYLRMLQELHQHLPKDLNVTLAINCYDEPLSWVSPLPPNATQALAAAAPSAYRPTLKAVWLQHSCAGTNLTAYRGLHGAFLNPPGVEMVPERLPIFSPYTLPGCFAGGWCGG